MIQPYGRSLPFFLPQDPQRLMVPIYKRLLLSYWPKDPSVEIR